MHITDAARKLIKESVRFAVWAAGEGICPARRQPADDPEEFLFAYATASGDEDYDTLADRIEAALAASPEPVAWEIFYKGKPDEVSRDRLTDREKDRGFSERPLYAAPQPEEPGK